MKTANGTRKPLTFKQRVWLIVLSSSLVGSHLVAMAAGGNRARSLCESICAPPPEGEVLAEGERVVVRIPDEMDIPVLKVECILPPISLPEPVCPPMDKEMIKEALNEWLDESCNCLSEPDIPPDIPLDTLLPVPEPDNPWRWGLGLGVKLDEEDGAIAILDVGRRRWRVFAAVTYTDWDDDRSRSEFSRPDMDDFSCPKHFDCGKGVILHNQTIETVAADDTSAYLGFKYILGRNVR